MYSYFLYFFNYPVLAAAPDIFPYYISLCTIILLYIYLFLWRYHVLTITATIYTIHTVCIYNYTHNYASFSSSDLCRVFGHYPYVLYFIFSIFFIILKLPVLAAAPDRALIILHTHTFPPIFIYFIYL